MQKHGRFPPLTPTNKNFRQVWKHEREVHFQRIYEGEASLPFRLDCWVIASIVLPSLLSFEANDMRTDIRFPTIEV